MNVTSTFVRSYPNCHTVTVRTDRMVYGPRYRPIEPEPEDFTVTVYADTVEVSVWSQRDTRFAFRRDTGRFTSTTSGGTDPSFRFARDLALWLAGRDPDTHNQAFIATL